MPPPNNTTNARHLHLHRRAPNLDRSQFEGIINSLPAELSASSLPTFNDTPCQTSGLVSSITTQLEASSPTPMPKTKILKPIPQFASRAIAEMGREKKDRVTKEKESARKEDEQEGWRKPMPILPGMKPFDTESKKRKRESPAIGQSSKSDAERSARNRRRAEDRLKKSGEAQMEGAGDEAGEGVVEKVYGGWVVNPGKKGAKKISAPVTPRKETPILPPRRITAPILPPVSRNAPASASMVPITRLTGTAMGQSYLPDPTARVSPGVREFKALPAQKDKSQKKDDDKGKENAKDNVAGNEIKCNRCLKKPSVVCDFERPACGACVKVKVHDECAYEGSPLKRQLSKPEVIMTVADEDEHPKNDHGTAWMYGTGKIRGPTFLDTSDEDAEENYAYALRFSEGSGIRMRPSGSCDAVHAQFYVIGDKAIETLEFPAIKEVMKVCTVANGKLQVVLQEEKFEIRLGGVWRMRKGESCTVTGDGAVSVVSLF